MPVPMESNRATFSLGPVQLSIRKGGDHVRRLGLAFSIALHVTVTLLVVLAAKSDRALREVEIERPEAPHVTVTFQHPFEPPLPPVREPRRDREIPPVDAATKPPRAALEVPDSAEQPHASERADRGSSSNRPAGGEAGGPLPTPTPGAPHRDDLASVTDGNANEASRAGEPPRDMAGRLEDFRRALDAPRPADPEKRTGGGSGRGGVTMPDLPANGMGIGNLEFESRDYDWSDYARQIYWAIWEAWHRRMLATVGNFEKWGYEHRRRIISPTSRIVFTIEREGDVADIRVEAASFCFPFDDSAVEALKDVVLPPLPPDFPRGQERVRATFLGEEVDLQTMREGLGRLQAVGRF